MIGFCFINVQGEKQSLPQGDRLVQVIVLILLTVLADGENAHIAGAAQKGICFCPKDGSFRLGKLDLDGIFGRCLIGLGTLGKDCAEPLKIHLIQVLNHSAYAPFV